MTDEPGDKLFSSDPTEAKVFITLGCGNEFGISDSSMFIRHRSSNYYQDMVVIDLGAPTRNEFKALIKLMQRMEIHLKDE